MCPATMAHVWLFRSYSGKKLSVGGRGGSGVGDGKSVELGKIVLKSNVIVITSMEDDGMIDIKEVNVTGSILPSEK